MKKIGEGARMDNHEARIILEKLFEGVHPETGEVLAEDHVCNDPQVLARCTELSRR